MRPEGWEEIVDGITSRILDIEGHDGDPNLVEAGADAMLDGLKEKRVTYVEGGEVLKLRQGETFESDTPGYLVFIEE